MTLVVLASVPSPQIQNHQVERHAAALKAEAASLAPEAGFMGFLERVVNGMEQQVHA